jgi:hypothetical protein
MSVSLVPLIYLNRSDLYVARSANVARYQPYPYRAMLAGHSMPSRPTGSAWRPHQGWAPIAVLIDVIPLRVSTEDTGTAIESHPPIWLSQAQRYWVRGISTSLEGAIGPDRAR